MRKRILLLLVICMLLLQAGCGGGTEKAEEEKGDSGEAKQNVVGGAANPWDLYTQAEAEAALGAKVTPEIKDGENHPLGQKIVFYDPGVDNKSFIQVSIVADEGIKAEGSSAKQIYEETKKALGSGDNFQLVEGFGDDAFWGTNGLHILAGSSYIDISTGNSSDPANFELAKKVAETVLSRL